MAEWAGEAADFVMWLAWVAASDEEFEFWWAVYRGLAR